MRIMGFFHPHRPAARDHLRPGAKALLRDIPLATVMGVEVRTVLAGDARVLLRQAGEGETALLLLHGAEADGSMWEPYMEGLARGRRVLAVDLPGHGGSRVTEGMDCTPAGIAGWYCDILAAEGLGSAAVLGHSFGGVVAFDLALEVPERVSHLVGVNVANLALATERFRRGAHELIDRLVADDLDGPTARRLLGQIYDKDPEHPDIVAGASIWADPGVRAFFVNGGGEFSRSLPVWRLRELSTPTLLVWGDRDRFFPVDEARTAALYIQHSRLVVIAGAGHSPFAEAPDLFHMAVDAFLKDDD
jgi:pimeloyl-ACP methyl ester carboxylesterase